MKKDRQIVRFSLPYVDEKEIAAVAQVLRSGWWTTGEVVRDFENNFNKYLNSKYSIAVNSGTAALHLALKAVGIDKGDEVIVPTMTFAATAEVVMHCGAKPVLCDCESDTLNIDIEDLKRKISRKTKVIIPVHMGGLPCRIDEIKAIAKHKGIFIIEDAAHALGAKYKKKKVGTLGDLAAFSFYVTKPISTGEGGMLVTNNRKFANLARCLSLHGLSKDAWSRYSASGSPDYKIQYAGFKYNLPDILAAIGLYQLKKIDVFLKIREKIAATYTKAFLQYRDLLDVPVCPKDLRHAWHLYIIKLNLENLCISRDEFIRRLKKQGIHTSIHFMPLHLHPFYRKNFGCKKGDFPNASEVFQRIVSLPLYPSMKRNEVKYVISKVLDILKQVKR